MSEKTGSEQLWEKFCVSHGIVFKCVPRQETQTPDYQLTINNTDILVEVKEFHQREKLSAEKYAKLHGYRWDEHNIPLLEKIVKKFDNPEDGWNSDSTYPVIDRLRNTIRKANKQLKRHDPNNLFPKMIVLCDLVPDSSDCNEYFICTAMFGDDCVYGQHVGGNFINVHRQHRGGRAMTERSNTSISAIAVLPPNQNHETLKIYHNPYTKNTLPYGIFGLIPEISQFEIDRPKQNYPSFRLIDPLTIPSS